MSDPKKSADSRHRGPEHASPYPRSRLAAPITLVDAAREIEKADTAVSSRVNAKLETIARQIRSLQTEAQEVLEQARRDMELHAASCSFERRPGAVYHLYERPNGSRWFSMIAPEEWGPKPRHTHLGSFRLEADMSWTPREEIDAREAELRQLRGLLPAGD